MPRPLRVRPDFFKRQADATPYALRFVEIKHGRRRSERLMPHQLEELRFLGALSRGVLHTDIAERFTGHGLSAPSAEQWYWQHMIIEPSARGAGEVRRLWLEALGVRQLQMQLSQ